MAIATTALVKTWRLVPALRSARGDEPTFAEAMVNRRSPVSRLEVSVAGSRRRNVAGSDEPLFAPLRATLAGRTRQARIAGHGSAVTHVSGQHVINERVCRFNTDADDPS